MPRPIAESIAAIDAEIAMLGKVKAVLEHKGPDFSVDGLTDSIDLNDVAAYNADETHDVETLAGKILTRLVGRLQALSSELQAPPVP